MVTLTATLRLVIVVTGLPEKRFMSLLAYPGPGRIVEFTHFSPKPIVTPSVVTRRLAIFGMPTVACHFWRYRPTLHFNNYILKNAHAALVLLGIA